MSQNSLPAEEVNLHGQRDFLFLKDNAMVPSRLCDAGNERFPDTAVHPPPPCLRLSPRASVDSASGAPSCCECEGRGWQGKWRKGLLSLSLSLPLCGFIGPEYSPVCRLSRYGISLVLIYHWLSWVETFIYLFIRLEMALLVSSQDRSSERGIPLRPFPWSLANGPGF